jgi:hypothetical protein
MRPLTRQVILFIAGTLAFLALPFLFRPPDTSLNEVLSNRNFARDFINYILLALSFYLNYFLLIPKLYFQQRNLRFLLVNTFCFFIVMLLPVLIIPQESAPRHATHPGHFMMHFRHTFFGFIAVSLTSLTLRISNLWKQTEKIQLNTQLSFLKAQINPHFLFNTLNSIYSLSIEKSEKTPDAIIRLSHMMRFVISEANDDFVPLNKEISYVTNYIELQKLRLGNTVDLAYKITGTTVEKKIAPLILIPFVENAFKHGVNPEENSKINVNIEIHDTELLLMVENYKVKHRTMIEKSGLGVDNARKRLDLLYQGKYTLVINDTPKDFSVSLKLNLT